MKQSKKTLKQWLWGEFSFQRLLQSLVFVYLAIALYAFFFADGLIFQPQPASYQDNPKILKLTTPDQGQISARYLSNPKATYTILYSHGNAEDLGDILPALEKLQAMGLNVLAYDYRGYGTSPGKPSEQNTYRDIEAAYDYLTTTLKLPDKRIILYGRSVGGGPSIDLATRKPVGGLIIESSFITAFQMITRVPLLPFDKFSNLDKIKNVRCPVLIIHGKRDRVVPFAHGQLLFRHANSPKRFLQIEDADHNDVMSKAGDLYVRAIREFIQSL